MSRKAFGLPVYTVGDCTVVGMRGLLSELGARPGGNSHVVITDLREELVLYINGQPYLRRELEMPAAALHHAGIQASPRQSLKKKIGSPFEQNLAKSHNPLKPADITCIYHQIRKPNIMPVNLTSQIW